MCVCFNMILYRRRVEFKRLEQLISLFLAYVPCIDHVTLHPPLLSSTPLYTLFGTLGIVLCGVMVGYVGEFAWWCVFVKLALKLS